jgi:hypothetical protein
MVAGLINSPQVENARPTKATIQIALYPVDDDPLARIRELEDALALSEAAYDMLVSEKQTADLQVSKLTHQINIMAHEIAYMRECYVPRSVVDVLNPRACVLVRR